MQVEPLQRPKSQLLQVMPFVTIIVLSAKEVQAAAAAAALTSGNTAESSLGCNYLAIRSVMPDVCMLREEASAADYGAVPATAVVAGGALITISIWSVPSK